MFCFQVTLARASEELVPARATTWPHADTELRPTAIAEATTPEDTCPPLECCPATARINYPQLHQLLAELEPLLQANRLAAKRTSEEIELLLQGSALATAFAPVSIAVRRLQFKPALEALLTFATTLPASTAQ